MALPSQMERSNETSRPVMSRSNRKANNHTQKIAITIGLAIVGLGLVFAAIQYLPGKLSKDEAATGEGAKAAPPLVGKEPVAKEEKLPVVPVTKTPPANLVPGGKTGTGMLGTAVDQVNKPVNKPADKPLVTPPVATGAEADPKPKPVDVTRDPNAPAVPPKVVGTPAGTPEGQPAATANETGQLPATGSTGQVRSLIEAGDRAVAGGKPIEARVSYSRALLSSEISKSDAAAVREKASKLNADLVFSSKVTAGDPLSETYTVASGDALVKIAKKRELTTDYRFIQRVNGITNPGALKIGQKLKLVRGPFHAVVSKSDYRLDMFSGSPDEPETWVYIRSFPVGLGSDNGTPVGTFAVKKNSKLVNPHWVNPKTGEKFDADDPKNPIGEYWLGWEGQGSSSIYTGFGLHGTIEPESIGNQKSMGCVRMLDQDIATVWEMLGEQVSVVKVVP